MGEGDNETANSGLETIFNETYLLLTPRSANSKTTGSGNGLMKLTKLMKMDVDVFLAIFRSCRITEESQPKSTCKSSCGNAAEPSAETDKVGPDESKSLQVDISSKPDKSELGNSGDSEKLGKKFVSTYTQTERPYRSNAVGKPDRAKLTGSKKSRTTNNNMPHCEKSRKTSEISDIGKSGKTSAIPIGVKSRQSSETPTDAKPPTSQTTRMARKRTGSGSNLVSSENSPTPAHNQEPENKMTIAASNKNDESPPKADGEPARVKEERVTSQPETLNALDDDTWCVIDDIDAHDDAALAEPETATSHVTKDRSPPPSKKAARSRPYDASQRWADSNLAQRRWSSSHSAARTWANSGFSQKKWAFPNRQQTRWVNPNLARKRWNNPKREALLPTPVPAERSPIKPLMKQLVPGYEIPRRRESPRVSLLGGMSLLRKYGHRKRDEDSWRT